jgi:transcriptional regulator with XRE-family HTH domain
VNQNSLGEVIRRRRIELGWTQEHLADRIAELGDPVRQPDISRLELNKVALPRRARLEQIAEVLNLPLGELLARSGWSGAGAYFDEGDQDSRDEAEREPPHSTPLGLPKGQTAHNASVDRSIGYWRLQRALDDAHQQQERLTRIQRQVADSEQRFKELAQRRSS